jgi:hypothetical protein
MVSLPPATVAVWTNVRFDPSVGSSVAVEAGRLKLLDTWNDLTKNEYAHRQMLCCNHEIHRHKDILRCVSENALLMHPAE